MKLLNPLFLAFVLFVGVPHDAWAGPSSTAIKQGIKQGEKALGRDVGASLGKSGAKQCVGGDSAKLAKALGITPKSGYQAHHILPVECKTHPVLNKIHYDLDQAANGIALPGRPGLSDKPLHSGRHTAYSNAVRRDLDAIPLNLSEEETARRVNAVIAKYRNMINSGKSLYDKSLYEGAPDAWR